MPQNPTSNPEKKTYLLSELVDCFKGKAVPSKAEAGDIRIINLSDMSPLGIDYHNLRTFQDEQRSLLKYLLQEADVLIASKGTVKKVAIFEEQDYPVVASANITILRPTQHIRGYYLKLFFDSEEGQQALENANKGKAVMNISTKELLNIAIPSIPLFRQDYLIQRYKQGLNDYKRKIARAEQEWERIQNDIRQQLS